jgi:hypothetical protein
MPLFQRLTLKMGMGSGFQRALWRKPTYFKELILNHFKEMVRKIVTDLSVIIRLSSKILIISAGNSVSWSQRFVSLKENHHKGDARCVRNGLQIRF